MILYFSILMSECRDKYNWKSYTPPNEAIQTELIDYLLCDILGICCVTSSSKHASMGVA